MNTALKLCYTGIYMMLAGLILSSCTSAPVKPKVYTVEIKDMKFLPDDITVNKGDTIIWVNHDMVAHDVTEVNTAWTSTPIPAGGSWKMAVTKEADYYCSIHVVMKGKIELN